WSGAARFKKYSTKTNGSRRRLRGDGSGSNFLRGRMDLDHTVYPDLYDPPNELNSPEERADYLHRVCAAWDHHVHPEPQTFALFSTWKEIFDCYPVLTSTAYHAF